MEGEGKKMEMTPELLALLTPEEREAWEVSQKATKGPWEAQEMTHYGEPGTGFTQSVRIGDKWEDDFSGLLWEDGQFIAAARTSLPAALVALAEMRRKVQEAEEKLLERTTQRNLAREARENWRKRTEAAEAKVQDMERERDAMVVVLRGKCSDKEWEGMPEQFRKAEAEVFEAKLKLLSADKMAQVADDWVQRGVIDARSALADARLNYGKPHVYEHSPDAPTQPTGEARGGGR